MNSDEIKSQLIQGGGLHKQSVEGLLRHHERLHLYLDNQDYEASGAHIGKFCENLANILRDLYLGGAVSNPEVGTVVDQVTSQDHDGDPESIKLTLSRFLRAAYDIRNKRNIHVNLDLSVNQSDTQAAANMCDWMLAELVRVFGVPDDMDDILNDLTQEEEEQIEKVSEEIDRLASPNYQVLDEFGDRLIVASNDLTIEEEILVLLYSTGGQMTLAELSKSIPDAKEVSIKSKLSKMKDERKIIYSGDGYEYKITTLGAKKAKEVIEQIEGELV